MTLTQTTLCLPLRGDPPSHVLLGLKKTGFGEGKTTGIGGKVEAGETIAEAAVRELLEEVGLRAHVRDLEPVGRLTFLFPFEQSFSQLVHVFTVRRWAGELREGREVVPTWFAMDRVPLERMWHDGTYWFPPIMAGQRIQARFTFEEDNETVATVVIESWDPSREAQETATLRSCLHRNGGSGESISRVDCSEV
jgi:8-oxo-dGTP diphosphatase